jgi:SAM-dependent methyltransferase
MSSLPDTSTLQSLDIPIPSKQVRYRIVSSHIDEKFFMDSGRQCAADIIKGLNLCGIDAREFRNILDFGCGCSRVLRYLIPFLPQAKFHGCDIDKIAIDWSQKHVTAAQFALVPHLPPTTYPREQFDFIYGLSVFSHLDLARSILWLDELRQILRPGGYLLLTVQGAVAFDTVKKNISKKQQEEFDTTGFLFLENIPDKVLPDWYQTSMYKEHFAKLVFQSGFTILRYDPQGMTGWQDLILLQKR